MSKKSKAPANKIKVKVKRIPKLPKVISVGNRRKGTGRRIFDYSVMDMIASILKDRMNPREFVQAMKEIKAILG